MQKSISFLSKAYFFSVVFLLALMIITPFIINEGFFWEIGDDVAEALILILLIIIGLVINKIYQAEIEKSKRDTEELISYVGSMNVQIDQMKYFFRDIHKYPETKNDLKYIYNVLADKVLSIVNVDWVHFRIIDSKKTNTLSEYIKSRGLKGTSSCIIGNKELLDERFKKDFAIIKSSQENLNLRTFCILSHNNLSDIQKIFLNKLVNDLGMIYVIFSSEYYKNSRINGKFNAKN
jgi:hypothetical protein